MSVAAWATNTEAAKRASGGSGAPRPANFGAWVSTYFTIKSMKQQTLANVDAQLDFLEAMESGSDDPRRADLVVSEFGQAANPQPIALFPNCPDFTESQWKRLIEGLLLAGEKAVARNRRLCYHPHLGTGVMKTEAIHRLMDETDPSLVNMLLDTAHQAAAGVDPLALARKYAHRIKHVHSEGYPCARGGRDPCEGTFVPGRDRSGHLHRAGDGSITTFPEILDALAAADFAGWICVEAEQDLQRPIRFNMPRWAAPIFANCWSGEHGKRHSLQPIHVHCGCEADG